AAEEFGRGMRLQKARAPATWRYAVTGTFVVGVRYFRSLSGGTVPLGTKPPGSIGKPPRPSKMKVLTSSDKRTAQSGRKRDSTSSGVPGNSTRLPLRSPGGAETLTVPGNPNGAEASMVLPDWKKYLDKIVMLPPLAVLDFE